jgi:hypothetical protein
VTRIKQPGRGWAYAGAIGGGAVSIAANIAHSFLPPDGAPAGWTPEVGAVVGAVVWPVFLFIAVEIFVRNIWPQGPSWGLLRWAGLLPVAGVAAFVSYRHLSGLLAHYGEEPIICIIGPLAVDGLMIMATGALYAGSRAKRAMHDTTHGNPTAPTPAQESVVPVPATIPAPRPAPSSPQAAPDPAEPSVPAPAPVTAPTPTAVKARVQTRREAVATKAKPTGSTPDTSSVTTVDPARRKPNVTPGQLARARHATNAYQQEAGTAISPGELAVRMRCSTEQASRLLTALNQSVPSTPSRDENRNGKPVPAPVS